MIKDLISDTITRLRNASKVFHNYVIIKYKKNIIKILDILKDEGFIKNYKIKFLKYIIVELKYNGWWIKNPLFSSIIRISKPGKKVYSSHKNFNKKIKNLDLKQGILIVSTSSGIMTHFKAREMKKGGEILFYIL